MALNGLVRAALGSLPLVRREDRLPDRLEKGVAGDGEEGHSCDPTRPPGTLTDFSHG